MSEIWGIPSPYQARAQKPPFWRFRKLRATLAAYLYGTKYDIHVHKPASALQTTRGLLHRLKTTWLCSTNGFKLDRSFYPSSVNSAFHFIARLRPCRHQEFSFSGLYSPGGLQGLQWGPGTKKPRYGVWGQSPQEAEAVCRLFTDFECRNDQHLKILHNLSHDSWPISFTVGLSDILGA